MIELDNIKQWYAPKINKKIGEFDEYDLHICKVIKGYVTDENLNTLPIHIHEGIYNTNVYIENGIIHVKPNLNPNDTRKS